MRGRTLASIVTLVSSGVFLTACGTSNDCAGPGMCPPEPGWTCTPVGDGGGANCYPPDGSVSDGGEDGAQDATIPGDGGGDATPDASRDAGHDGSLGDAGSDGAVAGDAAQDAGNDSALTCDGGLTACNGACVPLTTVAHCGACGTSCTQAPDGGEPACVENDAGAYACTFACNAGEHACNGACFPNTDPPSSTSDPCVISPTFGVFVSPTGTDAPDAGTMTAPLKTITYALSQLGARTRVYACGSATGSFAENVVLQNGVSLFGGLDCSTPSQWTYVAADKPLVNPDGGYALLVNGAATDIEDFEFTSANATSPGGSSIAVWVTGDAAVTFERCNITAGNGADAGVPSLLSNYTGATAPSGNAPDGGAGGLPGVAVCTGGLGQTSSGGIGGAGPEGDGGAGTASPLPVAAGGYGIGGAGAGANSGLDPCTNGHVGANGATETTTASGASAPGTATLLNWNMVTGQAGAPGNPGEGGGGGGGTTNTDTSPLGGGGGGAGGCGGAGGAAGQSGGSSIAVFSYRSSVTLTSCTLAAGNGGNGSAGLPGQAGQNGGSAPGVTNGCGGGPGGSGSGGGGGGGGAGGHAITVAYVGAAAPTLTSCSPTGGIAGQGGLGGGGGGTTLAGLPGAAGVPGAVGTSVPVPISP